MWPNHVIHVFLVISKGTRLMFEDDPEGLDAVYESLIRVDVGVGAFLLHPNQPGKMGNAFQLDNLLRDFGDHAQSGANGIIYILVSK